VHDAEEQLEHAPGRVSAGSVGSMSVAVWRCEFGYLTRQGAAGITQHAQGSSSAFSSLRN
jgi:hypothetical protein